MEPLIDLDSLGELFLYLSAFFGAFLAALWLSLVFWTNRDIRSRTRDRIIQILATLLAAILFFPGLLIYLIIRPKFTLVETYQRTLEEEALLSGIESKKVCPGCGSSIQPDWQVCAYCHTRIHKVCSECGKLLELPWQICPYCATPVPGSAHSVIEHDETLPMKEMDQPGESTPPEAEETEIPKDSE
jgi:RNA polymerase subunit RPABC4/transcription elongation factor Spt4